jgi:hypothetical protein
MKLENISIRNFTQNSLGLIWVKGKATYLKMEAPCLGNKRLEAKKEKAGLFEEEVKEESGGLVTVETGPS